MLLAGNKLMLELQHIEQRYIETDHPKRELVDHVFSLRQWDPKALIELRQTGECNFRVPELFLTSLPRATTGAGFDPCASRFQRSLAHTSV